MLYLLKNDNINYYRKLILYEVNRNFVKEYII